MKDLEARWGETFEREELASCKAVLRQDYSKHITRNSELCSLAET